LFVVVELFYFYLSSDFVVKMWCNPIEGVTPRITVVIHQQQKKT